MASSLFGRAASVALLAALAGCATVSPGGGAAKNGIDVVSEPDPGSMDPIAKAAFWGTRYDRDPANPQAAVAFSQSLRAIGNNDESLRVMRQVSQRVDGNADILLELGKSLIANERAHEAVRPIEQSIALGKFEDWSAYSSYGVALDMIGDHANARAQYDRALEIAPDKAKVLNNKGLSYALSGNRGRAETTLRAATAEGGTARIRQNYALVLALGGKTGEAERLARSDLPPKLADGNAAYFRQLVAAPAYWGELDQRNLDLPDFGDDPQSISLAPRGTPTPEPVPSPTPGLIKKAPAKPAPQPTPDPKTETGVGAQAKATDSDPVMVADATPTALEFEQD